MRSGHIDVVHARVETASGRVGVFTASRVSRKGSRQLRVFASGGYWSLDLAAKVAVRVGPDLEPASVHVATVDALAAEQAAFLGAVRKGGPFPAPGHEALWSLELAERIRETAAP